MLLIHGGNSASARDKIVRTFAKGTKGDPRVLIVSRVGRAGLNLPMANIMVMLVSLRFQRRVKN